MTWDASSHGWAALLRWWVEGPGGRSLRERLLIGTWPGGEDVSEQPYRECLAAPLALEAAAQVLDLRGRIGLLRNDAEAAIAALRKGSTQSGPMQRSALRASRLCARLDLDLLLWHVPGMQLVEEGVDGASRGGRHFGEDANLGSVVGPAVSDGLWSRIGAAVAEVGLEVTVDAFATESNRRARRYWSRYGEPGSEAVDALSVRDWGKSRCPRCGALAQGGGLRLPTVRSHPSRGPKGDGGHGCMRACGTGGDNSAALDEAGPPLPAGGQGGT